MKLLRSLAALSVVTVSFAFCQEPGKESLGWEVRIDGPMRIQIQEKSNPNNAKNFDVPPQATITVTNELHRYFPVYDPSRAWFFSGTSPNQATFNAITSLSVKSGTGNDAKTYIADQDYLFNKQWSRVGKTKNSAINPPVYITYEMMPQRIDSVVLRDKSLLYKTGVPDGLMPRQPLLDENEIRIANIYLPADLKELAEEHIYPILPSIPMEHQPVADKLLPVTMSKLRDGQKLRILAWGDSITAGYGRLEPTDRWQEQFVRKLKERFPKAEIELITNGWGGHTTQQFLDAPADSPRHYESKVLGVKPDLIISEFHNDLYLTGKEFSKRFEKLKSDFSRIHAEWIIMTPNWISPVQNHVGQSPEHIRLLRQYASDNNIPLADGAARWETLWKKGIPYKTLMVNNFNHPDKDGMTLYADSLMALFP